MGADREIKKLKRAVFSVPGVVFGPERSGYKFSQLSLPNPSLVQREQLMQTGPALLVTS